MNDEEIDSTSSEIEISDSNDNQLYLEKSIYVVFDLETTGLSKERNHIIESAAAMVDCHGERILDAAFSVQ